MAVSTFSFLCFCICSTIFGVVLTSNVYHQHIDLDNFKRLKIEFQHLQDYVKELEDSINRKKEQHKGQIADLEDRIKERKARDPENQIKKTQGSSKDIQEAGKHRRLLFPSTVAPVHAMQVAFSFDLSKDATNLGNHHAIIYDHELLNLGAGYNKHNGIFTVPLSGTYLFNWSTMVGELLYQGTELSVNGNRVSPSFSSNTAGYESSGKTVLVNVTRGDAVWIRTDADPSAAHRLRGDGYNSFSGYLVYPRE